MDGRAIGRSGFGSLRLFCGQGGFGWTRRGYRDFRLGVAGFTGEFSWLSEDNSYVDKLALVPFLVLYGCRASFGDAYQTIAIKPFHVRDAVVRGTQLSLKPRNAVVH